jgi:hypothetical protein
VLGDIGAAQTADDGIEMVAVSIKPAREPGHRPGSIISHICAVYCCMRLRNKICFRSIG